LARGGLSALRQKLKFDAGCGYVRFAPIVLKKSALLRV
jgi:hypothetical protein